MIITLDGPAGSGKSSLAAKLAEHFALPFLDTGAMYRGIALVLGEPALTLAPGEVAAKLDEVAFELAGQGAASTVVLNGRTLGDEIRTEAVSQLTSKISALAPVREKLGAEQRRIGLSTSLVAEGRDMGAEVFPHAEHKFFLDARPEVRAERRHAQLKAMNRAKGKPENDGVPGLKELVSLIKTRDYQDRTRACSPLRPAKDACIVDTSDMPMESVFAFLVERIEKLRGGCKR